MRLWALQMQDWMLQRRICSLKMNLWELNRRPGARKGDFELFKEGFGL